MPHSINIFVVKIVVMIVASGNTKKDFLEAPCPNDRKTSWFLTENNFDVATLDLLRDENVKYMIFQTEIGSKSGQLHYHAVITYRSARKFEAMKNKFPRAKIEKVRSLTNARNYCCKERTFNGTRFEKRGDIITIDERAVFAHSEQKTEAQNVFDAFEWFCENMDKFALPAHFHECRNYIPGPDDWTNAKNRSYC